MKDALAAAYGSEEPIDYYSYEPFQVYGANAVPQMAWVSTVGDLWRTGGDIRAVWRSILANAHANNKWAPNGVPGHYNDADMLEVGNGDLTLAEQRSHFALCRPLRNRSSSNTRQFSSLVVTVTSELAVACELRHFVILHVGAAMKSPLIIGADVRSLSSESLAILKNKLLLDVNQGNTVMRTLCHY